MRTRTTIMTATLLTSTLLASSPAQAHTTQAPLIAPARLALPVRAFGPAARLLTTRIDRTVRAVNNESVLAGTPTQEQQGSLYHSLGASGSLFERVFLPGTADTGGTPRFIHFMATAFPTTGSAQAAWHADTAFLDSYVQGCARRDLAVQGHYTAYACRRSTGDHQSYIAVTAVRGNVEFAFYVIINNDCAASLPQVQADASTLTRRAFATYAHLPVRRGAVRVVAPRLSPAPTTTAQPTRTPVRPTVTSVPPTSTPIPPTDTPVPPTSTPAPPPPTATPVPPTPTPHVFCPSWTPSPLPQPQVCILLP